MELGGDIKKFGGESLHRRISIILVDSVLVNAIFAINR